MPSNNQPDVTAPVSGNRSRFIGVVGNMDNGTAKGTLTNGNANNNIGGNVYRGAGQSSNQFPVSQASVQFVGGGGSAPQPQTSSNNPLTIQAQTSDRVFTEAVVQTSSANISKVVAGSLTVFPKSTETTDFGSSSSIKSNVVLNNEQPSNAYVGITKQIELGNNDPKFLSQEFVDVKNTNVVTSGRIDGKAQGANSVDKFIALGDNVQTASMNTLPGGVANNTEIGEKNVSGNI